MRRGRREGDGLRHVLSWGESNARRGSGDFYAIWKCKAQVAFLALLGLVFAGAAAAVPTERVSIAHDETEAVGASTAGALSGNGSIVAFESGASNLVPFDTNSLSDVFVRLRSTGDTQRVSVDTGGGDANAFSGAPDISGDGAKVVFESAATDLIAGDANGGVQDIFLRTLVPTPATTLLSVDSGGADANGVSHAPRISGNGQFVSFLSEASDLVAVDSNGFDRDLFVRDLAAGTTERIPVTGNNPFHANAVHDISQDGRYVVFELQTDFGDPNFVSDIFVYDRQDGGFTRISNGLTGEPNGDSSAPSISHDGRYVVFESFADNLVAGDENDAEDVFLHDRLTDETTRISTSRARDAFISGRLGRFVTYGRERLLSPNTWDVYLYDRSTGITSLESVDSDGGEANGSSDPLDVDSNGGTILFKSTADDLAAGDTNDVTDLFVRNVDEAHPTAPGPFVVNTRNDAVDAAGCTFSHCSLREAILEANTAVGLDEIHFRFAGAEVQTITPLTVLPTVTDPVTIDGYTQPGAIPNTQATGNDATLLIELNGNSGAFDGLVVTAGNTTIRGLVINRFNGDGIELRTLGDNTIAGNFIGTNTAGTTALPNGSGIFMVNSPSNTIGGTAPAARNVILGGSNYAVWNPTPCVGCPDDLGGGNTIQGNYIGSNAQGNAVLGVAGILISNPNNLIGGTTAGAGNVIANQGRPGIHLDEGLAHDNTIQGNHIGVTATGNAVLGNSTGIEIQRAADNLIGGPSTAARNVIVGTSGVNVFGVSGSGPNVAARNTVQGNYLGTNSAGTARLPAGGSAGPGVMIDSSIDNTVTGNVIAGFHTGVRIFTSLPASTGNQVQGNLIGTNAAGTAALPNQVGVAISGSSASTGNTIGGTTAAARNVISGNTTDGILINGGDSNTIQGNYIGVAANGTSGLANHDNGIEILSGSKYVIGGTASGAGNVIASNGTFASSDGVTVLGGRDNSVRGNSMHSNANLAIDLGGNCVTPNDAGDGDTGANNLQNFPVLTSVSNGTINGTLRSSPNTTYALDFFSNAACDASGNGEAARYLGSTPVTTDGAGDAFFTASPPLVAIGEYVTATATDPAGNTSELSACVQATGSQTFTVNSNADPGTGGCNATECTLREAIVAANATPDRDTIAFNIGGGGAQTISPGTGGLPTITQPVVINAATQPGIGGPRIELDGSSAGNASGLTIFADDVVVRGFVINGFTQFTRGGVYIANGSSGAVVAGNYIGTNAAGNTGDANWRGVLVDGQNNTIGGPLAADRNVISGNTFDGVEFGPNALGNATGNVVEGNYLGTDASGMADLGNGGSGVSSNGVPNQTILNNVASGNSGSGINVRGDSFVRGNLVGTNKDGTAAIPNSAGVSVSGSNTVVGGATASERNVVSGNSAVGISLSGIATSVLGNYVGTNAEGTAAVGNGTGIRIINATNTVIGGTVAGAGNLISGNSTGVTVETSTGTQIQGNLIGTNAAGDAGLGNAFYGIQLQSDSNIIGGTASGARNIVSSSGSFGIYLGSSGNTVKGNYIGTGAGGSGDLGNYIGVLVRGSNNVIGGTTVAERNVISGSTNEGVLVTGPGTVDNNVVSGNYIGTNAGGDAAIPNGWGVEVDPGVGVTNTVIGGTSAGAGNLISGNVSDGVFLRGNGAIVRGNLIGTDATGTSLLPNATGVRVTDAAGGGDGNLIGGSISGAGNTIAFNLGHGVVVTGTGATENRINRNSIHSNGALGIDLARASDPPSGVTANDVGDTDTGPNNLQNFPELSSAVASGGQTEIQGVMRGGPPLLNMVIEFFSSPACDGSGNGEGATFLGSITVLDQSGADYPFTFTHSAALSAGHAITATATTEAGDTSEFSACEPVVAGTVDLTVQSIAFTAPANYPPHSYTVTVKNLGNTTAAVSDVVLQGYYSADTLIDEGDGTACGVVMGVATLGPGETADVPVGCSAAPGGGHAYLLVKVDNGDALAESDETNNVGSAELETDSAQPGPTFTVNTAADTTPDGCTQDNCTLREAINAANAAAGANQIHFDIGAGGAQTIQPTSPLPALTGPTTIDGTTQGGFSGTPLIVVNGASAGALADGLVVSGGASQIRGLVVNGFSQGSGIVLNTAGNNVVAGNWIGANATNTGSAPNANGITIAGESDNNTIGGTVAADRNVIRGNTIVVVGESFVGGSGVTIQAGSTGNALRGNDIFANTGFGGVRVFGSSNTIGGTVDGAGNVVHSNNGDGIALEGDNNTVQGNIVEGNGAGVFVSGATNVIGGTTAAARNVISGNEGSGVWIHGSSATGNEVLGNYIGTDAGGTLDLGNDSGNEGTAAGVFINSGAANNIIGGVAAGAGNVLSGNETAGVLISNAHTNQILGNKIGTNADGDAALPNGVGVEVSSEANGNVIGGNDPSERNLISGNEGDGIQDSAEDTVIQGNYIGTNAGGSAAIGNGENGIRVQGLRTEIGGASDEGNVISGNSARGVLAAGAGTIQIRNNYVGTDATGEEDLGNGGAGIQVEGGSSNVEIGADDGRGNVISGNVFGVAVFGAATTGVTIEANLIGTDDDGDEDLGNSTVGVDVDLGAAGVQIARGNVISGNGQGIEITGASNGTTIQGNLIGTDESGAADLGNDGAGVYLESVSGTTLGGTAAGARNVISGNGHGIVITGAATSNQVQGNYIGTNAAGGAAVPNDVGIAVTGAAAPNTIGGVVAAAGNVISGNTTVGLRISASDDEAGQTVNGNVIGVGADGTTPLGNAIGILVDGSPNNEIGDPSATARNVIGFNDEGIVVTGGASSGNVIAGNFVGVSAPDGGADLGNVEVGIRIVAPAGGNLIGGPAAPDRNIVSGNGGIGIDLGGSGNSVQNNLVGTNAAGAAIGNTGVGISITGSDNTIGGNDPATANKIAFNGTDGVAVMGSAVNNRITANSIVSNGSTENDIGIDLAGNGVSGNDPNDADSGPNNHQNFPVLNAVTAEAGSPRIVGTLQSAPSTAYRIDYFETPCAGPGDREGDRWLGWSLISTNADGVATIDTGEGLTSEIAAGEFVTATATDPDGNTSEFSACTEVTTSAPPADAAISLESSSPSVIAGAQSVPIDGISLSELTQDPGGTRQSAPMDGIPMDGIDLAVSPMDGIPMDGIGLTPGLLNEVFGGVHLSDVPLSTPGGWDAVLAGTPLDGVPLNTITLADVYALTNSPINDISLGQIDLSRTPMDGIPLVGLALGPLLLSEIPLDEAPPNDAAENLADWCAEMNEEPGYPCANPNSLQGETLIAATVRGLPMDGIPMDGIPMDGIDLSGTPMDGIPMDGIDLTGTPMDGIPMDGIDFAVSPMDGIPMDGIDILGSAFADIEIDDISPATRDQVVDCTSPGFDCTGKTLGDAKQAGRIKSGANLGMLDGALGDITLGEVVDALLGSFGLTLADLFLGLPEPPERTLHDLLSILLGATAYEWSDLSLTTFPIAQHSPDGGVITYQATFTVTGGSSPTTATIHATVPDGGVYKDSSTALVESASAAAVPLGEPTLNGSQLEWKGEVEVDVEYRLTWQVHAPLRLGSYSVGANVTVPGMASAALSSPVTVAVVETLEPNDTPGAGPELAGDTLYLSHMPPGDVDRYVVPIPTAFGSTVKITLSHIAPDTDLDLVVAGPPSPTLRNAPANTIPLQNGQLPDTEVALDERGQPLAPELLPDVPSDAITTGGNVIRATSINRSNADEELTLLSQGETGEYIVQVSRYEGASPMPYMLQVEVEGPPDLGTCDAPRAFRFAGQGVAGTMPSIPANVNTLILVNQKRLGDTYGSSAATSVIESLNELAGRADLGIVGAVIPVESSSAVNAAYTAWDGNPCSPAAANNVVSRIGELIDSIEPDNLQYKVIVGGDDQIPFGRVADETVFANEQDYAASLPGPNNQYKSAYAHGLLLTDDVWAEEAAPQFLGHELFVPDQAVGRLVETPNEITGMISAFLAMNGAITQQRSLTTGYDFLTDGANAVNAPFSTAFGANARTLINETWPARDAVANDQPDDLEDSLFPPGPTLPPQLNSINAHFDHTRLLPAAENAANRSANLYTSQDVRDRGAAAVAQRILFSMGCHSGLATSDEVYGSTDPLSKDWAQTFLAGGAFAWIGNTGFGLGDTVDVAYTERLHAFLTGNLDGSLSLGEALAQAKQEYLAELAIVSGYDAKVVMQTTLYGLPMLDVGTGTPPATPAPLPLQPDPATGLQSASFNQTPSFTLVSRPNGSYYRAETTQVTNRRPIEPVVSFDVTQPGRVAHGVVITSLHSQADEANFDAAFSRVVNDKSEDEPEVVGEASHPAKIQSISTFSHFASPASTRQNAVLIAGLYRSDGNPDPSGVGVHRLYDQIGGYVLYASPSETDFTPPSLEPLQTLRVGNGVGFAVDVSDAEGTVEDVKVIYRDCSNTWRLSTLQPSGEATWSGGGALASTCTTDDIDYYVQAVDDAGNVAVSSRKAQLEPVDVPPATGETEISFSLTGTLDAGGSGWYESSVEVTITATPDSDLEYSLDGGALVAYNDTPFVVSGDGVHLVEVRAEDGSTNTVGFAIDTTGPTVLMKTPPEGAVYHLGQSVKADFTCADSGSGIASCSGTPANGTQLDTGSLGTKTITVTATDNVGKTTNFSRQYQVVYRQILFASSRTGRGDIYAIPSTGGTPAQLTTGNAIDAEPAWSPDGEKVAFTSTRDGNVELYLLHLSSAKVTRLTTTANSVSDTSPAFSPDGSKIAFASNRPSGGSNLEIYVMDAEAGDQAPLTKLTQHSAVDTLPTWSHSGQEIAFMSTRTGNGDIYKTSSSSLNLSPMRMTTNNGIDSEPAWSPVNGQIAFATNRHGNSNWELYLVNSVTKQEIRLTNQSGGSEFTPTWSRDGKRIAFMSTRSGNGDIYNAPVAAPPAVIPLSAWQLLTSHSAIDALPDW